MTGWIYRVYVIPGHGVEECPQCRELLSLNVSEQEIGCWACDDMIPSAWLMEHEQAEERGGLYA